MWAAIWKAPLDLLDWVRNNPGVALRIALRYTSGSGLASAIASDNDLLLVASIMVGSLAEGLYAYAKRKGSAT